MRRIFRFVVLGLVLLLVMVLSMLTAMRLAIHGREVLVPGIVGMRTADAQKVANDLGLRFIIEDRFYSSDYAEGRIMLQSPPARQKVRRGWALRVAESLGPQRAVIPNVVGQSPRAAEINIRRRGLEVGTTALLHIADMPVDQVVAQSPSADAKAAASPKVSLLVNAPADAQALVMPELVGHHFGEVSRSIEDAGLRLGGITDLGAANVVTPGIRPDFAGLESATVVRQFPAAGSKVSPGMTVSLEISH